MKTFLMNKLGSCHHKWNWIGDNEQAKSSYYRCELCYHNMAVPIGHGVRQIIMLEDGESREEYFPYKNLEG